jgi:GNAT superfamily N-acetyltransferase
MHVENYSSSTDDLAAREKEASPAPLPISLFDDNGQRKGQATVLTEIGQQHHLFHDTDGEAFARVTVADHAEVFRITGSEYRDLLCRAYFLLSGAGANRNAITDAVATLTATARYAGPVEAVHLRTGTAYGGIVIDTGAADWSVIEVTDNGWRIRHQHGVNFRRTTKATALPIPMRPDFSLIWKYVNVEESDRVLVAGWLLAALRPHGPFPILLLLGEQGTGKSYSSRTLKALTDPSGVPLRPPPRDDRDLLVAALNSWVLALDNLSGATPQLSDALCRLATGGALAGRKLYTDTEESAHNIQRPVILNGIDDLASRPDLAERCIHLALPTLTTRATESDMAVMFKVDAASIMAALLDGLALALRDHRRVNIGQLPRMADFAKWAAAGVPALGFTAPAFVETYRRNQADAVALGLEASAVASTVRAFVERHRRWKGTARELLNRLNQEAEADRNLPGWPHTPKGLQTILRRLAPSLRSIGIQVERDRDATNQYITLSCKPAGEVPQVPLCHSTPLADGGMVDVAVAREHGTGAPSSVEFDV